MTFPKKKLYESNPSKANKVAFNNIHKKLLLSFVLVPTGKYTHLGKKR